jgi:hypothetical protein
MKLSHGDIARIEELLTLREKGMTTDQIAAKIGASRGNQISIAFFALRLIGVGLPPIPCRKGLTKAGRPLGSRDTKPSKKSERRVPVAASATAPRRAILTAEQWQERLAAQGF